jgi:peptidyl-prolyl cis-trans isomerase C
MSNIKKIIAGTFLLMTAAGDYVSADDNGVTTICAEHILVRTEDEAKQILQDIKSGKISFEDAAKKNSQCPSGENGGNLGYFGRGAMVKEFEDVAFVTGKNEISEPVKTRFGWHLIKVIDRKTGNEDLQN